jgi:hypothetical protein
MYWDTIGQTVQMGTDVMASSWTISHAQAITQKDFTAYIYHGSFKFYKVLAYL